MPLRLPAVFICALAIAAAVYISRWIGPLILGPLVIAALGAAWWRQGGNRPESGRRRI